ncbi:hypothetical protein ACFV0T_12925 [Streptomyces sp. NPDC059582]|uniref:hypothetical protein n=1 Tax=Streptomyces sp. NPDC059582 TaxID=3346875 RepID=UPI003698B3BE
MSTNTSTTGDDDASPVPVVPWGDAWEFTIGDEERPAPGRWTRPVLGVRAVLVPHGGGTPPADAPCAFLPPQGTENGPRLYEDAGCRRLLCSVDDPEEEAGARGYRVRDGQGQVIGTVRRVPPLKHALKPTWRIDQPGRPEIVSDAEWSTGGVPELVRRGAGKLLLGAVQAVADLGADGGDQSARSRVVVWRADGEPVLAWDGRDRYLIRAAWFDRRLAFTYALLRAR